MISRRATGASIVALLLIATSVAVPTNAHASGTLTLEATYSSPGHGWDRVERWHDTNPGYITADYPSDGRLDQTGQRLVHFDGDPTPDMGTFLVSYAPGWSTNPKETPVLLVPGAYTSADTAWAAPDASPVGCGALSCPSTGMMQSLAGAGYKVFGITFPHAVGNNNNHAEQIHGAVQVITAATGTSEVDIVAWSMGTLASRLYVSGATPAWATPYAHDVRKLVLIGGPNKGWDYTFRHGTYPAIASYSECGGSIIGGTAAIWQNCFGFLYSHPELTPYVTASGDYFPGVRQMLRRWDSTYPVNLFNPDAFTTYYGGTGYYGQSYGIQYAVSQGSLISTMRASTVPSSIETYLLCGTAPNIPSWNNELDGPSDGTILTASCHDTGSIGTVGGNIALALNHLRLTWSSPAVSQVSTWLG